MQITEPYPAIFFRHIGRVVGGDRRIPSYSGDYRYAREDKGVEVQLLLFESFGGFGKGVREILRKAADVLQNKLTRAQYLDEVTWTTKSWLGLQKQRISVSRSSHGNRRADCE